MNKFRLSTIIFLAFALVFTMLLTACGEVADEYKYNTEIIDNTNAPVQGEPEPEAITGYVEDADQKFLKLPYAIEHTSLEIVSIGKYTGVYTDSGSKEDVEDILAIVFRNTSTDKVVSFSSIAFEYDEGKSCTFNPTNLPAGQSAIVFTSSSKVAYKDVKKLSLTDAMEVPADELPLLEGVVGVDFKDGEFIVTNMTGDDLGDVYIRYKNCSDGNAYLGGITYSVYVSGVEAYETYKVAAPDFDPEKSVIIAVENYKP